MNDPLHHTWRQLSWRRKLTPAEEAELRRWLEANPSAQADWESEAALTDTLGRLPDVPVASNFTARVLQAVEREDSTARNPSQSPSSWWRRFRWAPRAA